MQQLIEDLLRYSRVATQGRPFAPVDLGQVTAEVLDDLESSIQRSGAVVRVGELPTVDADALQLRQLLQNLVSNALKFRREGSRPRSTSRADRRAATASSSTVRDNGIGFDPQYARRIFRVFERLHGRGRVPRHRHRPGALPQDRRAPRRDDRRRAASPARARRSR